KPMATTPAISTISIWIAMVYPLTPLLSAMSIWDRGATIQHRWGTAAPLFPTTSLHPHHIHGEGRPKPAWRYSQKSVLDRGRGRMIRELYAYVWRSSASQQIILIILAIIAAVLATAPLELQRHIINTLTGHEKFERLGWLCGGYLIAALVIGGLKYIVNIRSAGLGEFTIRSLREEVLRHSSSAANRDATPGETRKNGSGALVTTISSQAEAVGKFVGDCISTPIVQAGTLVSVLSYMLYT